MISVCHLLRSGVAAIFGPQSAHTASHVQSICDTMEIPHLETRWDYRLRRQSCLVNLYPHPTTLSKVRTPNNTLIREILEERSSPFLRFSLSYERDARETRSSFDSSFTNCVNSASRFSFEPFNETRSMFRFIVCNFLLRLFLSMFSYCL